MPLSELQVRNAKPAASPYKLFDSGGLFLFVSPNGSRLWRFRFKVNGRENLLSFGAYPKVGLAAARKLRNAAIEKVQEGIDPAAERRREREARTPKALPTFEELAREWHELRRHEWTPAYAAQVLSRLEADIFPSIGRKPVAEITPAEMLAALKKVEARGVLETNRRLKQYCSAIFRYAIASQRARYDPAAPLKDALKSPPRAQHHKALARNEVGEFLIRLDGYGEAETRIAINLALLMVPRTTELRASKWSEFENWRPDQKDGLWRIPAERMKMEEQHLVPLSRQAIELIAELHTLTGESEFLFPGEGKDAVMSNNTMLFGLYRMGYRGRTTTHGFRRLFSTEANEHGWKEDWIERQLAHDERDRVRAAYNAAQYLPQRREMMQWWADRLDALKSETEAQRRKTHPTYESL